MNKIQKLITKETYLIYISIENYIKILNIIKLRY